MNQQFLDQTINLGRVCCLPRAKIKDVTGWLTKIINSRDYCPFFLFRGGTKDTKRLKTVSRVHTSSSSWKSKRWRDRWWFLPCSQWKVSTQWEHRTFEVNRWLRRWLPFKDLWFLDHNLQYLHEGLPVRNGRAEHNNQEARVFGNQLAHLIRRVLSSNFRGREGGRQPFRSSFQA